MEPSHKKRRIIIYNQLDEDTGIEKLEQEKEKNDDILIPEEISRIILSERAKVNLKDIFERAIFGNIPWYLLASTNNRHVTTAYVDNSLKDLFEIIYKTEAIVAGSSCVHSILYNILDSPSYNTASRYWDPSDIDIFVDSSQLMSVGTPYKRFIQDFLYRDPDPPIIELFVQVWITGGLKNPDTVSILNEKLRVVYNHLKDNLLIDNAIFPSHENDTWHTVCRIHPFEYEMILWYIGLLLKELPNRVLVQNNNNNTNVKNDNTLNYNKNFPLPVLLNLQHNISHLKIKRKYITRLQNGFDETVKTTNYTNCGTINGWDTETKTNMYTEYKFPNESITRICTYNFGNKSVNIQIIYVNLKKSNSAIHIANNTNDDNDDNDSQSSECNCIKCTSCDDRVDTDMNYNEIIEKKRKQNLSEIKCHTTQEYRQWTPTNIKEWIDQNFDLDICKSKFDGKTFTPFGLFKGLHKITHLNVVPNGRLKENKYCRTANSFVTIRSDTVSKNQVLSKLPNVDIESYPQGSGYTNWYFEIPVKYDDSIFHRDITDAFEKATSFFADEKMNTEKVKYTTHVHTGLKSNTALCTLYTLKEWEKYCRLDRCDHNLSLQRILKYINRGFTIILPTDYIVDMDILLNRIGSYLESHPLDDHEKIPLLFNINGMYIPLTRRMLSGEVPFNNIIFPLLNQTIPTYYGNPKNINSDFGILESDLVKMIPCFNEKNILHALKRLIANSMNDTNFFYQEHSPNRIYKLPSSISFITPDAQLGAFL